MFDNVSRRYDLLNAVMTLGQDAAWREAMWRRVPGEAGAVLDLCTGSGVSLTGLKRPGRTVLGIA
jgi:demethylmenaquinone methyltransferase/2-methoxy-6-polyprenyl-1,4-benzoquinol methylase